MILINNKKQFKTHLMGIINNDRGGIYHEYHNIKIIRGVLYQTKKPLEIKQVNQIVESDNGFYVTNDNKIMSLIINYIKIIIPQDATIMKEINGIQVTDRFIYPFPWYIILVRKMMGKKNIHFNTIYKIDK